MGKIRKLLNEVKSFMGNPKAAKPTKKVQKPAAAAKASAAPTKKAASAPVKPGKAPAAQQTKVPPTAAQKAAKAAATATAKNAAAAVAALANVKAAKGAAGKGALGAPVSGVKGAPALPSALARSKMTPAQAKKAMAAAKGNKGEASGEAVCREVACEGLSTTNGYCRLHYIKNWKKIKRKELILKEKKLNQYIEELVAKYPDKYIEAIRQDLANDKDFAKVIHDLDLDESIDDFDVEGDVENLIDTIKRDFEDEGEAF